MKFLPRVYEWPGIRYNVVRHYTGAPPRADQREAYTQPGRVHPPEG